MKHFTSVFVFIVLSLSLSFGDVFLPQTIQKTSVVGIEWPTCLVQNCIDSLVYVVSYSKNKTKSIIFILNEKMQLVDSIVSDSAGDSLSIITAIYSDSLRLVFASHDAIYLLEAGKLKKKALETGGVTGITFFQEKWYLATSMGLFCYNPVNQLITKHELLYGFTGIAKIEDELWSSGEKMIANEYFVTQKTPTGWTTTSSKDISLSKFFEYVDIFGMSRYKMIRCTFAFEGSVYVGGTAGLLIKRTATGWEDCMAGKEKNFSARTVVDGLKNVWSSDDMSFIVFNLENKTMREFGYGENDLPEYQRKFMCVSTLNKSIVYFAYEGFVVKYNPNPTNISPLKKELYIPSKTAGISSGVYDVKGRLLFIGSQNYKHKLSAGIYFLKTQFGFKKIVMKK